MRLGIRGKILIITGSTFLLALLTIGFNTFIVSRLFKREYSAALQLKVDVIADTVRSQFERLLRTGMAVEDIEGFETQCREALYKHQDLAYTMVVRADGTILFHNDVTYKGTRIDDPEILKALKQNRDTTCVSEIEGQTYSNTVMPVGHHLNGVNIAVIAGFPTSLVDGKIQKFFSYSIVAALAFLGPGVFVLMTSLSLSVTKSLSGLVTTIHQIRDSSDLSKRVQIVSRDELGDLAESFNRMTEDLQNRTTSIDNLHREIEHRKEVEKSLRRSENRYRTLLKNIPQRIFYKDLNSVYLLCNASYAGDLGIKPDEIKGKTDYDFYPKYLADKYRANDLRVIEFCKREETEESFINEGKEVYIHTSKSPVKDEDGNVIGIFGIFWDITAHKKAEKCQNQLLEQLEKANQELKDFAYIVSHDLKAPLRGIKTLAGWMLTDYVDKLGEDGKEKLNLLSSRVERMHNLIEGILQYSRIGRIEEEYVTVDLNKLVPDIIDMLVPPENIKITIENRLPVIECEQTRIAQIFQNLLSNSIKYMDKPQGVIRIGCVEENGNWKFSVADNGPGIEEKYFDKIFQIFQTLSTRDEYESTGIGLTVVKKVVELHGGRIWVESKIGLGSTFFFTIPLQFTHTDRGKISAGADLAC